MDIDNPLIEVVFTSRKKTIAIQIEFNRVRILAPRNTSKRYLNTLLEKRHIWIQKKLLEKANIHSNTQRSFLHGETFLFKGKEHSLDIVSEPQQGVRVDSHHSYPKIILSVPNSLHSSEPQQKQSDYIRTQLRHWYIQEAEVHLNARTHFFAQLLEVSPRKVLVKHYKSRWGTCTPNNEIYYNWKIIMAPLSIIDYLVVHELCHLIELNHSKRFWQHVASIDSEHKEHRRWLRSHGQMLEI